MFGPSVGARALTLKQAVLVAGALAQFAVGLKGLLALQGLLALLSDHPAPPKHRTAASRVRVCRRRAYEQWSDVDHPQRHH